MRGRIVAFVLGLWFALTSSPSRADEGSPPEASAPSAEAERGLALFETKGCVACHSLDGRRAVGPTFLGSFGQRRTVSRDGEVQQVKVDADYISRAVRRPAEELAEGYPVGTMPPWVLEEPELAAMIAAFQHLSQPATMEAETHEEGSLHWLVWSALVFVFGHLGLSSIRERLIAKLGQGPYMGLFSLMGAGSLGGMIYGWSIAPYLHLWHAPMGLWWITIAAMPVVMIGQWVSFNPKTPFSRAAEEDKRAGSDSALGTKAVPAATDDRDLATGVFAITRHPGQITIALWGLVHIPPNGDVAALIFFGTFVSLAILGVAHIEARRRKTQPEVWARVAKVSSVVPFAAMIGGRARFAWRPAALPIVGGLGLYGVVLSAHLWLFGASPFPF